jgi:hypothetical protein
VEQNRGSGFESTKLCPLFLTNVAKMCDGEKTASSTNDAWKSGYPYAKK